MVHLKKTCNYRLTQLGYKQLISSILVEIRYHPDAMSHTTLACSTLASEHVLPCNCALISCEFTILALVSLVSSHILVCVVLTSLHAYTGG